ncbi:SCL-interrupting locus protein [Eudromia elegans]
MGDVIGSHVSYYRNPKLSLMEKTLRLAYRHAKQNGKQLFSCFLLGTLLVDEDGEGISVTIDRFDPGREIAGGSGKIPTASLPGDFLIPCTISSWGPSSADTIVHSAEDISLAFEELWHSLCSKDSLDLSKLLTIRAHIVFTENLDNLNFDFHWASITAANILEYTPLKSVPIIPTALARNLSSPINIAQVQGTLKCGYLTMDQTRKLLLLLESDPKAYALPLVGVWLSGVTHICNPQIWACCLRYLFSSSIQERVFSESGRFLIVLYSLTHKEPEFYECVPSSGQTELGFQLLTCNETIHLFKNVEPSDKSLIQFELNAEKQNAETEFFSRICKKLPIRSPPQGSSPSKLSASDHDSGVEDEDLSPRPIPSPHPVGQQATRIFPSVPELSLVLDGSFVESRQLPKAMGNSNAKSLPSALHQPIKKKWPLGSTHYPTPCSDDKPNFANIGDSSSRHLPNHLNQKITTSKAPRGKQAQLQQQSHCRKVGPQTRKSSGSSSSSPSTPCSGPSPDASVHHPKRLSETLALNPDGAMQQEEPAVRRTSVSSSKQPSSVPQPFLHSSTFTPEPCRRPSELQVPVQVPSCCLASTCNCQFLGPVQYNPTNLWQRMGKMSPKQGAEIQLEVTQETPCAAFHQNIICPNTCCNTGYATSSPINLGYHGKMGNCALDNSLSPGVRLPSSASPCSVQCCAAHSPCAHTPASRAGSDNGMMGLSPDAYRVLTEQDRQLKLLQAQIQRLLEAQAHQACPSEAATPGNAPQLEKQVELVAMETQSSSGLHTSERVSIAVSTGASLFWNTPSEKQDESIPQGKKEDEEISKEEINLSINAEQDASNTSIASSLKVVDIPSFVDSIHLVEEGAHQNAFQNTDIPQAVVQNSSLEENISMSLQKEPTEGASNHSVVTSEQSPEPVVSLVPQHQSEDQRLYQDLLGQVNQLLKSSEEQEHLPVKAGFANSGPRYQNIDDTREKDSKSNKDKVDKEDVISATLKQLRNLGVAIESPGAMQENTHKVESASVLACINPDAVVPGLNYMSFANVSMCGLTPNVADLSMEANAIALKYLSENQLSRLSLSHSGRNPPADFSFQDVLHTNMDKSMVGLSLISPSNMSFATKKYMRRYGLIQGNDGSEDEEEIQVQGSNTGDVKSENALDKNINHVLEGYSCWTELSKRTGEKLPIHLKSYSKEAADGVSPPELNSPVFRNITNEVLPPRAEKSNENSIQILKDLKLKHKLLPGKVEFTEQPGRKDVGDTQVFPRKLHAPALETLNHSDSINSVGTILDVKQLRQLPKLF